MTRIQFFRKINALNEHAMTCVVIASNLYESNRINHYHRITIFQNAISLFFHFQLAGRVSYSHQFQTIGCHHLTTDIKQRYLFTEAQMHNDTKHNA